MAYWKSFLFGGVSAMFAESVTFPMDTAKTRLQIQGQKFIGENSTEKLKYRGLIHTLVTMRKEEGVKAFYSGVKPALLRQSVYGSIKFGVYNTLKKLLREQGTLLDPTTGRERFACNVFCAACAGVVSSAIANPTDVLKVRLQQHPHMDRRLIRGFVDIYQAEGIRGLWRGVNGTAQRAAILTAVGLPTYDYFIYTFKPYLGNTATNHIASAALSSFLGAVTSTPFDVLRTRVMDQKFSPNADPSKVYKGIVDCFFKTIRNEGVLALYKGLIPIYLRMGPWNMTFFLTYEQLRKTFP